MHHNSFAFLLLTLSICFYAHAEKCRKLVHELANTQQVFVFCSVTHSVPVDLCIGCFKNYTSMRDTFAKLAGDQNCTEKYFNKDRINIVTTMQNLLTGIWSRAYCDNCFTNNNTEQFGEKMEHLSSCISQSYTNICEKCLNDYLNLNDFYKRLDPKNQNNICYDMQDAMNRTRQFWSKELKCCQRERHLTLFLVAINVIALIPIIFYSSAYFLTKRSERNHDILIEQSLDGPSTRDLITAAILATPGPMPEDTPPMLEKPLIQTDDPDSSSDEDNMLCDNALKNLAQRAA